MIVGVSHHKGGTGKTTTCINLAGFAAKTGARVLVIDLDPQANATSGLGVNVESVDRSMLHVLRKEAQLTEVLLATESGAHLAPAKLGLIQAEPWLYASEQQGIDALTAAVEPVKDLYDLILIDTPPGAGVLMLTGMAASDRIVTPLDPGVFALEDVTAFQTVLSETAERIGRKLQADTAVVTRVQRRRLLDVLRRRKDPAVQVIEAVRERFKRTYVVPYDNNVFESHRLGLPLSHFAPDSPAGRAYRKLSTDLMKHG